MNDIIYTSPSGQEFKAQQRVWQESFNHSAPAFPIAKGNGDKHQDLGIFSPKFSIRFEFTEDSESERFYAAMIEKGAGTLTEPDSNRTRRVQPLTVTKTKGLVKDIGRTIFTVQFAEDLPEQIVVSSAALRQLNNKLSEDTTLISANHFEGRQNITTAAESVRQQANFSKTLEDMNRTLSINVSNLEKQIDLIVQDPINAMISTKRLMELPGIAFDRVTTKINGYADLVRSVIDLDDSQSAETANQRKNDALYLQSMGSMSINAMSNNVVDSEYKTKQEALNVAQSLVQEYENYRDALDNLQSDGAFDQDGSIQQALSQLVYNTVGLIFELSFSLKTEFIFEASELTTIYDIAAEYYPDDWRDDEESTFNFIAETNNYTGNDFIYLNPGREVKVYV